MLQLVFEGILLGQGQQFEEWLAHRKMPNMVLSDNHSSLA